MKASKKEPVKEAVKGLEKLMEENNDLAEAIEKLKEEAGPSRPTFRPSGRGFGEEEAEVAQEKIDVGVGLGNELDEAFWEDLAASVDGAVLPGGVKIADVLDDKVFASLEKQICDAHLDYLRAKRRMTLLNKLMDSAYELIDSKLGPILVQSTNDV